MASGVICYSMPVEQFSILITPVLWIESKPQWKIWLCCSNNGANQTNLKVAGFCGKEEIGICPVWVAVLVRSSNKTSCQQENQDTVQLDHFWWTSLDWLMHCLDDNPSYISWQGVDFLRIFVKEALLYSHRAKSFKRMAEFIVNDCPYRKLIAIFWWGNLLRHQLHHTLYICG